MGDAKSIGANILLKPPVFPPKQTVHMCVPFFIDMLYRDEKFTPLAGNQCFCAIEKHYACKCLS